MIELTEPLQQALDSQKGEPVHLVDPRTNEHYVLLPQEVYDRVQDLLSTGPLTEGERRGILQGVWQRARWDDPAMDDYEALVPPQQP